MNRTILTISSMVLVAAVMVACTPTRKTADESARAQVKQRCDPRKGEEQGRLDAMGERAANPGSYCDDKEFGPAYAAAYSNGYRAGAAQLCETAISDAEKQGHADGLEGKSPAVAANLLSRCPSERQEQIRAAYTKGVAAGEAQACEAEIANVKVAGREDGRKGARSLPAMKRCPAQRLADFEAAYSSAFALGEDDACRDEIKTAGESGEKDGYAGNPPTVPQMKRCQQQKLAEFKDKYMKGFALGMRKACRDEMRAAVDQARTDAQAGDPMYPPPMIRCSADVADPFTRNYYAAYSEAKEDLKGKACPSESSAFRQGFDTGEKGGAEFLDPDGTCMGERREQAMLAYQYGLSLGRNKWELTQIRGKMDEIKKSIDNLKVAPPEAQGAPPKPQ